MVVHFKDDATAGNGEKKAVIEGKGVLNQRISEYLFSKINDMGLPTHFMRSLNMRENWCAKSKSFRWRWWCAMWPQVPWPSVWAWKKARPAPLHHRTVLQERQAQRPHGDGRTCHRLRLGHTQEMDDIVHMSIRINDFLSGLFLGIGIKLVDFKLEFGRWYENDMMRIVLADEISPDNCRLWDIKTNDKMDKDRFRRDMGGLVEAYQEVAQRLGIIQPNETPERSKPKLVKSD